MSAYTCTNENEPLLAVALSIILSKVLSESNVSRQSQQSISKVSLFDQNLTSFVYKKVGIDASTNNKSLMTL
jgi:hypothetical protein